MSSRKNGMITKSLCRSDMLAARAGAGHEPTAGAQRCPHRFATAASGTGINHAGHLWAFATLTHSTGTIAHYRRQRQAGDRHAQDLRRLFNHCRQARVPFDEMIAFPTGPNAATG